MQQLNSELSFAGVYPVTVLSGYLVVDTVPGIGMGQFCRDAASPGFQVSVCNSRAFFAAFSLLNPAFFNEAFNFSVS